MYSFVLIFSLFSECLGFILHVGHDLFAFCSYQYTPLQSLKCLREYFSNLWHSGFCRVKTDNAPKTRWMETHFMTRNRFGEVKVRHPKNTVPIIKHVEAVSCLGAILLPVEQWTE